MKTILSILSGSSSKRLLIARTKTDLQGSVMMKKNLWIWSTQHRMAFRGVLLTIVAIACTAIKPQPSAANFSPVASSSIASIPVDSSTETIASTESLQQEAVQVIRDYYIALDYQNYELAYLVWDRKGAASGQSFEQFSRGFSDTACTSVVVGEPGRLDGAAGSIQIEIPVVITATTTNRTRRRFRGSYMLRRVNNVPGSTSEQRKWHLYSANIAEIK